MPTEIVFVQADDLGRIQPRERRLVRRHCALGRNKQPESRRSKREAARAAEGAARQTKSRLHGSRLQSGPRKSFPPLASEPSSSEDAAPGREPLPPPPPSDWALFPFPEELDIRSQEMMHKYFVRNPIREPMCPFKHFQISIDSEQDRLGCFQLLCLDTMSLYATLLSTSASEDLASNRPLSNVTRGHLRHTLAMLGSRLGHTDVQQHDQLIYVISILALIAVLFDDQAAVAVHSAGLRRIIALRGGFRALGYSPMLQISLDRINFTGFLLARQWTPLFDCPTPKPPDLPAHTGGRTEQKITSQFKGLVDPELAAVFQSLQQITVVVNDHYHSGTSVPQIPVQLALEYAHSRLLGLKSRPLEKLGECLRLGMMAFLATTICMPDSAFPYYCKGLAVDFYSACVGSRASIAALSEAINTWLVIMFRMVAPGMVDNAGICVDWTVRMAGRQLSWDKARGQLKSVLWLDPFHDVMGRRAFEMLKDRHPSNN